MIFTPDQANQLLDLGIKALAFGGGIVAAYLGKNRLQIGTELTKVQTDLHITAAQRDVALSLVKMAAQTIADKGARRSIVAAQIEQKFPALRPSEVNALLEQAVVDLKLVTGTFQEKQVAPVVTPDTAEAPAKENPTEVAPVAHSAL